MSWQPTTTQNALRARDHLYRKIRHFFSQRHFLEVDPPLIGRGGSTDPHLHSWQTNDLENNNYFLQTSPEFFLKRLLAEGSGPIFALTKAFRQSERGRYHNPEFSMLEWYQPGFDDYQLMTQVGELIQAVLAIDCEKISYREMFYKHLSVDPHTVAVKRLKQLAQEHLTLHDDSDDRDFWLDALLSNVIQPALPKHGVFVHDYPASQAALAKIALDDKGQAVARRFELFVNGVELANGYWELTDSQEQSQRFDNDNQRRRAMGLSVVTPDERLLQALEHGMPESAGVALGVDRLLMLQLGADSIDQVIPFPIETV